MNDQELTRLLRDLPREQASPGFTAQVLRRVRNAPQDERRATRPKWTWLNRVLVPVGSAFLLLALLLGHREWTQQQERAAAIARLENLRVEQQAIESELAQLQQMRRLYAAAKSKPVLYLGRSGDLDLVVDLDRLRRPQEEPSMGEAVSAASSDMAKQPLFVDAESLSPTPATFVW